MGAAYYRSGQAATMLGISTHSVRRLCEAGLIEAELSEGGQWRIPASEIERIKQEGVPPIPSSVEADAGEAEESEKEQGVPEKRGLLAPPSQEVVTSAEDVVVAENRLKKLKINRETEETQDWFRHRETAKAEAKSKKRQAELEKIARAEAERARIAWHDAFMATALVAVPQDAPPETRLSIRKAVSEALVGLGPQNSMAVIQPLVVAAVVNALQPWLKGKETTRAIEAACDTLPWGAKSFSTPTVWQARANKVASTSIRELPWDSSYQEKLRAGTAAIRPIVAEFEHSELLAKVLRQANLWDLPYEAHADAKEAIEKALKALPVGTPQSALERTRERALVPLQEACKKRKQEAEQKQRVERLLGRIRSYLEELEEAEEVKFEGFLDLWNFADRIRERVRKAVLKELQREDLSDEEIETLIEQLVDESLED